MSAEQLRADLFELKQLSLAVGLDPSKVGPHVATIRREAEALLGDPAFALLAAEVVRACDTLELQPPPLVRPEPEPDSAPTPEPALEPIPARPVLRIGLTCGDKRWIWRFPEDIDRLRQEWREGYLPVHLTPEAPSHRGILGEVVAVDDFGEIDLRATLTADDCVLHLPEGDLGWRLHIDVAILRDGEHLSTWRFPHGANKLLEEWRAAKAPLRDMPRPRAASRPFLGEVGPPTGAESAWLHLAPGHETRLVLEGRDHPLKGELDMVGLWWFEALGAALHARGSLPVFAPGDTPTFNAIAFDGQHLVRLAAHDLTAEELRGARLQRLRELVVGSVGPEVIEVLIAGTSAGSLRSLCLYVDAPALVAHANRLVRLDLQRVPVPPLPATLRELHLTGPVDAPALAEALRSCPDLQRLVLRAHGLDVAALEGLQGDWVLDAGLMHGQALGLDDELHGLRPSWDDLDPVLLRWMVQLWTDITRIAAIEGVKLSWRRPSSAGTGAADGLAAMRRVLASGAVAALLRECAEVLEVVRSGVEGDYGNAYGTWMRPFSEMVVRTAGLSGVWTRGSPPPLVAGDHEERARQVAEIGRLTG